MNIQKPHSLEIFDKNKFEEVFFSQTRPIQFSGMDENMPAYNKWSFSFFKEKCGNFTCQISDNLDDPANITRKIPISEYISLIENNSACPYMTGWSYQRYFPELDQDIDFPEWHPEDFINQLPSKMQFRRRWIFFGKQGVSCDLHIDCFSTSAWLLMIKGQKTFRAISPLHRHHIDMKASLFDENVIAHLTSLNIEVLEFTLTPGEILYVPTGWVHEIRNDSDNIMVTGGFTARQHAIRFYKNYHTFIARESIQSEESFVQYLNDIKLKEIPLSNEVINSIEEDLAYTRDQIELLKQKQSIYEQAISHNT
ncbi:cupin-like domain-containing protein [Vibrio cholerae]|nr:hypothetical protein FLL71_17095 [Vibrio cholerae]